MQSMARRTSLLTIYAAADLHAGLTPTTSLSAQARIEDLIVLGFDDFFAAVETAGANVMTQMRLARGRLYRQRRIAQMIMGAVHTALGRRLLVLLNGHAAAPYP
jgi:hypothetical protein